MDNDKVFYVRLNKHASCVVINKRTHTNTHRNSKEEEKRVQTLCEKLVKCVRVRVCMCICVGCKTMPIETMPWHYFDETSFGFW